MSDERFRQVVRRALDPVVGGVGDGPEWTAMSSSPPAPRQKASWRIALAAGTLVTVAIGIVALVTNDAAVTDVLDGDTTVSPPSTDEELAGGEALVSAAGEIVFAEGVHPIDALGTGAGPLIVMTTTEPPGEGEPPAEQAVVTALDPETGEEVWSQSLGDGPFRLASSDDAVWIAHFWTGALTKLSLATGEVLASAVPELPFDFGSGPDRNEFVPNDLEVAFGSVWMSTARSAVARFDIDDGTVQSVIPILVDGRPDYVAGIAADDAWLWIARDGGGIDRLDPADESLRHLTADELGQRAGSIIVAGESVLVGGSEEGEAQSGRLVAVNAETMTIGDGLTAPAWIEVIEIAEKPIAWTEGQLRPITFFPLSLGDPLEIPSTSAETTPAVLHLAPSDTQWRIHPESRSISRIGAPVGSAGLSPCTPGVPKQGIDLRFEDLIRYYNVGDAEQMISVIGDGPVSDPSLEPGRDVVYPSVTAWLDAAQRVGDTIATNGYGMGEPFELYVDRSNPGLEADGIERLTLTFRIWANQDCELRVEATGEASYPDVCLYSRLHEPEAIPTGCTGPYEPRAGHTAVWTGEEMFVVGGWPETPYDSANQPPVALGVDGSIRTIAPPPVALNWYPGTDAFWTGDRLLVVAGTRNPPSMVVLAYAPSTDMWTMSPPLPDDRFLGGAVWTGSELLLVGGVQNGPDDQAWSYNPSTGDWTRLPDPGIPPVEGMRGVWTGTEAIFYGGYAGAGESPGVAWNPATGTWRTLAPAGREHISHHELAWTGEQVIVYSGHSGPGHPDRLLLYDPDTDAWTESAPIPITPAERLGGAWTGTDLILWGGYATYGDGHTTNQGARYNPATDTWTIMADSPRGARCDHSLTWTGEVAIVFGGVETCGHPNVIPSGDGATYDVTENEWQTLEPG